MPHADKSTRTPTGVKACPYCGRPIRSKQVTCGYHYDLPALEPFDDRYVVGLANAKGVTTV